MLLAPLGHVERLHTLTPHSFLGEVGLRFLAAARPPPPALLHPRVWLILPAVVTDPTIGLPLLHVYGPLDLHSKLSHFTVPHSPGVQGLLCQSLSLFDITSPRQHGGGGKRPSFALLS